MGQSSSSNRRKQKEAADRNSRSYFLQACSLLIFASLMLYVFKVFRDDYESFNVDTPDYINTVISACVFIIVGCVLAITFYWCDCNDFVKFIVAAAVMLGGILFMIGYSDIVCSSDYCDDNVKANQWAMPTLLLFVCIMVSIQIATEFLNTEEKRVSVQCLILVVFCWLLLAVYYDADQDNLNDNQKSIESGGTILWLAALVTMVVFLAMSMERGNRIIRIILVCGILAGAIILFSGYSAIVDDYDNLGDAYKINILSPAILALLVAIVLAIDVLV